MTKLEQLLNQSNFDLETEIDDTIFEREEQRKKMLRDYISENYSQEEQNQILDSRGNLDPQFSFFQEADEEVDDLADAPVHNLKDLSQGVVSVVDGNLDLRTVEELNFKIQMDIKRWEAIITELPPGTTIRIEINNEFETGEHLSFDDL